MTKRITALTSVALLLMLMIPTSIVSVKAANDYTTYVQYTIGDPMNADPCFQYDVASLEMLMNVYEPLVFWDFASTNDYIGIVAESWYRETINVVDTIPEPDMVYTERYVFKIREGIHFHQTDDQVVPGEDHELNVTDVEYSFERNMVVDAATGGECLIYDPLLHAQLADLEDFYWGRKIDFAVQSNAADRTVSFYLPTPFEPFLQVLCQMYGAIMCKEWVVDATLHPDSWDGVWPDWTQASEPGEDNPQNWTRWTKYHDPLTSPIENQPKGPPGPHLDYVLGTGPYMFNYWVTGDRYSLIKNPNYWRGWSSPGHVDNFVSYCIEEWTTRRDAFQTGDADHCTVPVMYKSDVEEYPGIRVCKDLLDLACMAEFLNQNISGTSTYIGTIQPDGQFSSLGFCKNGFTDIKLRKAFRALFPYATWIAAAYLGEAATPATCVIPGLNYHDPTIPKQEYNRNLAIQLLKEAWGGSTEPGEEGPVWTNGFYMCFVYNEGNEYRKLAAEMLRDEFESLNDEFFGGADHFHGEVTMVVWNGYNILWRTRVLPFYAVGWGADFPDPHNFVVPFMHSQGGAFARFQGISNATIDAWIEAGIAATDPEVRRQIYHDLQQAFVDNCYSFTCSQAKYRRWERDWVQGWFFHPVLSDEEYVYNMWEEDPATVTRDLAYEESYVKQGGSWTCCVKIVNDGEVPEYFCLNVTYFDSYGVLKTITTKGWIAPKDWGYYLGISPGKSGELVVCVDLTEASDYGVAIKEIEVAISNWVVKPSIADATPGNNDMDTPYYVALKAGDVGAAFAPFYIQVYWAFDGKVTGYDVGLLINADKADNPVIPARPPIVFDPWTGQELN